MKRFLCLLLIVLPFFFGACNREYIENPDDYRSEQQYCTDDVSSLEHIGALNAVKKAYQLTDIEFTPLNPIGYNIGTYQPNVSYTGMIYSSVKEIGTYVGSNVSFHTFMTAIHNSRSLLYSEKINHKPYNGTNCKAYYGTVCSGLVSYALGLFPGYGSYDFPASDLMEEIDFSNPDNIHIADVLWRDTHVAIITDVIRNQHGRVVSIELSESAQHGANRRSMDRNGFKSIMKSPYEKVYRYKELYHNTNYSPASEFVAVLDEVLVTFKYNDSICANKGDKANYLLGEDVVLNVFSPYQSVSIYKDNDLFLELNGIGEDNVNDITLKDLPFGSYKAVILTEVGVSESTSWIVVDFDVLFDQKDYSISFKSKNATPVQLGFCKKSGGRSYPLKDIFCRALSQNDVSLGRISVPKEMMKEDCPFFQVSFQTEYGIIPTRPININ